MDNLLDCNWLVGLLRSAAILKSVLHEGSYDMLSNIESVLHGG